MRYSNPLSPLRIPAGADLDLFLLFVRNNNRPFRSAQSVPRSPLNSGSGLHTIGDLPWAAASGQGGSRVTILDGTTLKVSSVPVGGNTSFVTVDASANQIYVVNLLFLPSASYSAVMVIDGATNSTTTLNVSVEPRAAAANAATHESTS